MNMFITTTMIFVLYESVVFDLIVNF